MKYPVVVKRSKRKTLSLMVTREQQVLVRAPLFLSAADVEAFILRHEEWIETQIGRQKERLEREKSLMLTPERIEELKEKARTVLAERVRYYGALMRLRPSRVGITLARTRWGSCSGKNSLNFSFRLILLPPEAVDYVVVHELAHIRIKNHGAAFYREVETYLPDYRRRIALLREAQIRLGL